MKREEGEMTEKIEAWVLSPEGQAAMEKARRETNEIIAYLREARRIDWKLLHIPID